MGNFLILVLSKESTNDSSHSYIGVSEWEDFSLSAVKERDMKLEKKYCCQALRCEIKDYN